jgi:hypothetical protein
VGSLGNVDDLPGVDMEGDDVLPLSTLVGHVGPASFQAIFSISFVIKQSIANSVSCEKGRVGSGTCRTTFFLRHTFYECQVGLALIVDLYSGFGFWISGFLFC